MHEFWDQMEIEEGDPEPAPPAPRPWWAPSPFLREIAVTVVLAAILFFTMQLTVQNFRVVGSSMEPSIQDGQYLLVNKLVYTNFSEDGPLGWFPFGAATSGGRLFPFHPPNRGDMVVFHSEYCPTPNSGHQCIKRVIGLPGETVEVKGGRVYVDGGLVEEQYIEDLGRSSAEAVTLDDGSYYVLGDNRRGSYDSRNFGAVGLDDIIGKAWVTYWPPSSASVLRASPPPSVQPPPPAIP